MNRHASQAWTALDAKRHTETASARTSERTALRRRRLGLSLGPHADCLLRPLPLGSPSIAAGGSPSSSASAPPSSPCRSRAQNSGNTLRLEKRVNDMKLPEHGGTSVETNAKVHTCAGNAGNADSGVVELAELLRRGGNARNARKGRKGRGAVPTRRASATRKTARSSFESTVSWSKRGEPGELLPSLPSLPSRL